MSKITDYAALLAPAPGDVLPIVDVSDTSMAATGTTKKIAVSDLVPVTSVNAHTGAVTLTASDVAAVPASSLPLAIGSGGTGQVTQQAALDALAGAVTSGRLLRGDGTHVTLAALAAGDVPTLNQSTTGNAATATNLAGGAVFPAYVAPHVVTLTDAATVAVNAALGNDFRLLATTAVGASRAMGTPTGASDGQAITFALQQPASGGPCTLTWAAGYSFGTDSTPVLTATASAVDVIGFRYHASLGKWLCAGWKLGFS